MTTTVHMIEATRPRPDTGSAAGAGAERSDEKTSRVERRAHPEETSMLLAVFNRYTSGYDTSRSMREQELWDEHAEFMDGLTEEGFVILGGTLGHQAGALLIIDAEDEQAARTRLAADPWVTAGMMHNELVEPWTVLLGEPPRAPA